MGALVTLVALKNGLHQKINHVVNITTSLGGMPCSQKEICNATFENHFGSANINNYKTILNNNHINKSEASKYIKELILKKTPFATQFPTESQFTKTLFNNYPKAKKTDIYSVAGIINERYQHNWAPKFSLSKESKKAKHDGLVILSSAHHKKLAEISKSWDQSHCLTITGTPHGDIATDPRVLQFIENLLIKWN